MKRQRQDMEEKEDNDDHSLAAAAMEVAIAAEAAAATAEEEQCWGAGAVEEMTWSSVWLPFWDVEFVGRNYGVLFNDVVWDDDIWNIQNLTHSS
ncbi:hypothetical protein CARUB_v10021210mg [Capsella rubella]|uniref:Uncharacterized protein n=1 Tax=Capsella rubella TaxID=81985 RepID=R0I178_9BRAS|nr:uncharacterized protein LOC17896363 [Capsella rubella]EOA35949.1 hypothetical protein CARUB_v10021210mg [Capsella rubella]